MVVNVSLGMVCTISCIYLEQVEPVDHRLKEMLVMAGMKDELVNSHQFEENVIFHSRFVLDQGVSSGFT